jgi:hypothetical protein
VIVTLLLCWDSSEIYCLCVFALDSIVTLILYQDLLILIVVCSFALLFVCAVRFWFLFVWPTVGRPSCHFRLWHFSCAEILLIFFVVCSFVLDLFVWPTFGRPGIYSHRDTSLVSRFFGELVSVCGVRSWFLFVWPTVVQPSCMWHFSCVEILRNLLSVCVRSWFLFVWPTVGRPSFHFRSWHFSCVENLLILIVVCSFVLDLFVGPKVLLVDLGSIPIVTLLLSRFFENLLSVWGVRSWLLFVWPTVDRPSWSCVEILRQSIVCVCCSLLSCWSTIVSTSIVTLILYRDSSDPHCGVQIRSSFVRVADFCRPGIYPPRDTSLVVWMIPLVDLMISLVDSMIHVLDSNFCCKFDDFFHKFRWSLS